MEAQVDILYENIRYLEMLDLSNDEKLKLIDAFHECYFDTPQEVEVFAVEFQRVVGHVLAGHVPVALKFLIEFQDRIYEAFESEEHQKEYEKFL